MAVVGVGVTVVRVSTGVPFVALVPAVALVLLVRVVLVLGVRLVLHGCTPNAG
ncbi:hypothetical protein GCM10010278_17840 [Streptomyces melanogenes]|nr:hypothetical protein GCM10010278_17840 [Streptomyces melanogenes]